MSGFDITNELRINWDENEKPPLPFFSASSAYTPEVVIEAVRRAADAHILIATRLEGWIVDYERLPVVDRRDWLAPTPMAKGRRPYTRKDTEK